MEYTVHHASQPSVPMGVYNRHFSVMVTCNKKISAGLVYREVTSSHSVDIHFIDRRQISIRLYSKDCDTFIGDGIQIFSVQRTADM